MPVQAYAGEGVGILMNINLLDQLLNESESAYLDFKKEQYPFEAVDDNVKSELLKDILAFTNAWRRTDAYILIGVEEVRGGRSKVVGITKHLDDHSLQQFVNSKTQQPITFSYISTAFEKLQIGIIKIPVQSRPVYLKKDYGKLKKNIVYIRRGSSTDEASPDEIAKMGIADIQKLNYADVSLEFADLQSAILLGKSITFESKVLNLTNQQIPDFVDNKSSIFPSINVGTSQPNKRYYRELVKYFDEKFLLNPVGFAVKNLGQVTVHNVRMLISLEQRENLQLLVADQFSERPKKYFNFLTPQIPVDIPSINKSNLSLETYSQKWVLSVTFGNVQPKAMAWSDEAIYIGSRNEGGLELDTQIFADELSEPISTKLNINFETEEFIQELDDLAKLLQTEFDHLLDEINDD